MACSKRHTSRNHSTVNLLWLTVQLLHVTKNGHDQLEIIDHSPTSCLFLINWTSKQQAHYLWDESVWTVLHAATVREQLSIKPATSPCQSILTQGQPVPKCTPWCLANISVPYFFKVNSPAYWRNHLHSSGWLHGRWPTSWKWLCCPSLWRFHAVWRNSPHHSYTCYESTV